MSRLLSFRPRITLLLLLVFSASGYACSSSTTSTTGTPTATGDVFAVQPPPTFRTQGVRMAVLNTEFMFDGEDPDGAADFPWKANPTAANAHIQRIGDVIKMLHADVIVLEEVENRTVLERLIHGPLEGMGYLPYLVPGKDTFTRQNMAILSKIPIDEVGRTDERAPLGSGNDTYGISKNIWARLTLAGVPTTIIGVHYLAIPDNAERKPQREAQAEVTRRLAEQELAAGRAVIVAGDFNDFDDQTLDRRGNRPITNVLATVKRAGPGDADDLHNVLADVPQAERFSNFYDRNNNGIINEGELSAIDHILLSPALRRKVTEVTYVHSHDPRLVTDHFPIVVTFRPN
ncbi:MAG: endonuclease/exonuclease/phosphatase family protein [Rhodothermales bacterium]|nr:endonuclease/exonuclease/phosphatase family protein [Rhodothermales bacterium]